MAAISRREFLKQGAAGAAAVSGLMAGAGQLSATKPLGLPIGSQTYPHRAQLAQDHVALFKQMKAAGIESIELCSPFNYAEFRVLQQYTPQQLKQLINNEGLTVESCHFGMNDFRQNTDARIQWARELGLKQMATPTLAGPTQNTTMADIRKAADEFSAIGRKVSAAGMKAVIHNEGFELTTVEGRKTYDMLIESTDPQHVFYQFQASTASRGYMAADYFRRYPGRFVSMHVQDLGPNFQGQQPVGQGTLPWREIFTAAKVGGLERYYIEMNWDLTKASVPFLRRLTV